MDAITALTQRVSAPKLIEPAPSADQLDSIRRAALRAADHGNLRPWRFLEVAGPGLEALGALYLDAGLLVNPDLNDAQQLRLRSLPLRAPMIVVAIAKTQAHPKVPREEQLLSAACAVQNMLNAAFAMELGAFWRTGEMALDRQVATGLGLNAGEEIVGFLYLGHVDGPIKQAPELNPTDFFEVWPKPI
ncbi:nitroreductase [Simiduia curdlanivorans]|uniref:Putative NAD(P)H nitroreductase n=1 Tax=Simiduia curdlanivorans TaxID=1492769 RepID=A0ABV8V1Z8_9GAMM|nr:nitroreductase [Simiduia curdlanivorans]MDN3640147.1 nitroreductase [Simiduia curdlanivorans]